MECVMQHVQYSTAVVGLDNLLSFAMTSMVRALEHSRRGSFLK